MKKNLTLKSLDINPNIYFFGTDEAIEEAERKEEEQAAAVSAIISAPDFIALEYKTETGAKRILHRSTRPGVFWQLSYIAADGIPTMHENFNNTDESTRNAAPIRELLRHFVTLTLDRPQDLTILTA